MSVGYDWTLAKLCEIFLCDFISLNMKFDIWFDMIRVCLERDMGTKNSTEDDSWRYINCSAFIFFLLYVSLPFPPKVFLC